jgi:hypothetical protein
MANSTTNLDTISAGQSSKEVTANALFDAGSSSTIFGRRASTTTGLTWGYYGGRMLQNGALTTVNNGTVSLTNNTTNYVEATDAGVVSVNTTGFTAGRIPNYTVVTSGGAVSSYTDERAWVSPAYIPNKASISITSADVTLSAAQARCEVVVLSGTLTGNRNLIVPNSWRGTVINNTSGSFSVTVKTSAGTGATIAQGYGGDFFADGTNVIKTSDASGASINSFSTISVSGQSDVVADSGADTLTFAAGTGITITTNAGSDTITITNSGTASNSFTTIAVSGQSDVEADSAVDTLTLVAGTGMSITTDPSSDAITFNVTSGSTDSFKTISVAGQSDVVADSGTDTLTLAAGTNISITTNASTDTITINSTASGSITLGTPATTTSGTNVDFGSIPSGTKEITINFVGVSTSGTSNILIQIGDSGGIENTGYLSSGSYVAGSVFVTSSTAGFVVQSSAAADVRHGSVTLRLVDSTNFTWVASGVLCKSDANVTIQVAGSKSLSAQLDRVRITTANGTDTFDAGLINIMYQ